MLQHTPSTSIPHHLGIVDAMQDRLTRAFTAASPPLSPQIEVTRHGMDVIYAFGRQALQDMGHEEASQNFYDTFRQPGDRSTSPWLDDQGRSHYPDLLAVAAQFRQTDTSAATMMIIHSSSWSELLPHVDSLVIVFKKFPTSDTEKS